MKKYLFAILFSVLALAVAAQVRFVPQNGGGDGLGITYSLPVTAFKVDVEVIKVTQKAGPYAMYAERFLGIKDAVKENREFYRMGRISLATAGVPDRNRTFVIEVGAKSAAPRVQLSPESILCGINLDAMPESARKKNEVTTGVVEVKKDITISSEELLVANSTAKMAEVVSQQIYRLRESRTAIMTGELENMPRDGEGIKLMLAMLDEEERSLVAQFAGQEIHETNIQSFYYEPSEDVIKAILFRFSPLYGIVDKEDLSGAPIYYDLKGVRTQVPEMDVKEQRRFERDFQSGNLGMMYCVPGEATIDIYDSKLQSLSKGKFSIAQFGEYKFLPLELFNEKKGGEVRTKIEFYPETGAIKEIVK